LGSEFIWHEVWGQKLNIEIGDLNLGIEHLDYDWGFGIRNEIWDQGLGMGFGIRIMIRIAVYWDYEL